MSARTHAVKFADLQLALLTSQAEAKSIVEQVNSAQGQLAQTVFVGDVAENLSVEMNEKMSHFVETTYVQLDELLRVIVNNMNVVVTKLGGAPWTHEPVAREVAAQASTNRQHGGTDYEINLEDMEKFASLVDNWFASIVSSYQKIRGEVCEGTTTWIGPEKNATVTAVDTAIETILGSADAENGTGVRGVGASLSGAIRSQVAVMESA